MPKPTTLSTPTRSKGGQNPPNTSWERPPDPKGSGGSGCEIERLRAYLDLIRRLPPQSDLSAASDLAAIAELCRRALETRDSPPELDELLKAMV